MYHLSQKLPSVTVKLQERNLAVNAGMGGELHRNKLLDIAKSQGAVTAELEYGQEKIVRITTKEVRSALLQILRTKILL
jgi:hypothetical protein